MSTDLTPNQVIQLSGLSVATLLPPFNDLVAADLGILAILLVYELNPNIMFGYPLTLTMTLQGSTPGAIYYIQTLQSPSGFTANNGDSLDPAIVPDGYGGFSGATGPSLELARQAVSADGQIVFNLDLATLNQLLASSTSPADPWDGTLPLFLFAAQIDTSTWNSPQLTADFVLADSNRDTGRSGYERARGRMRRCPTTGLMESSESFVRDGYTGTMVSSLAWDPPEPPPRIFGPVPPDPPE